MPILVRPHVIVASQANATMYQGIIVIICLVQPKELGEFC